MIWYLLNIYHIHYFCSNVTYTFQIWRQKLCNFCPWFFFLLKTKVKLFRSHLAECCDTYLQVIFTSRFRRQNLFLFPSKPLDINTVFEENLEKKINTYWVCEDSNFLKVRCASGTFSTILHKGFSRVAFITSREKHFKGAIFSCIAETLHNLRSNFLVCHKPNFFIV